MKVTPPVDASTLWAFIATIRPWFTTAGVVTLIGMFLRDRHLKRTAKNAEALTAIEAKKAEALAEIDLTKLADAREESIRDHYATEVAQLRAGMEAKDRRHRAAVLLVERHYRTLLRDAEARHDECQRQRDELREQFDDHRETSAEKLNALRDLVAGLNRTIIQYSADSVIALGDVASPEVLAAAHRVDRLFNEPTEGDKE